jgi:hypothetical protein
VIVILGDGKSRPVALNIKYLAIYDERGRAVYAADQLNEQTYRQGIIGDPDLPDIIATNGLPFKPVQDVTGKFEMGDGAQVFS